MSDAVPGSTEHFRDADPLEFGNIEIEVLRYFIRIRDKEADGLPLMLNVQQARVLRECLNRIIPESSTARPFDIVHAELADTLASLRQILTAASQPSGPEGAGVAPESDCGSPVKWAADLARQPQNARRDRRSPKGQST